MCERRQNLIEVVTIKRCQARSKSQTSQDLASTSVVQPMGFNCPQRRSLKTSEILRSTHFKFSSGSHGTRPFLQRNNLKSRTPVVLISFARNSVKLHTTIVDACQAARLANSARRLAEETCEFYSARRRTPAGELITQVTLWTLIPWLTASLADLDLGREIIFTMRDARQAALEPVNRKWDTYDGSLFRTLVADGCTTLDSDVLLSISSDGVDAL